jgi:LmbE family N-acetylglucosaminyl deacetylase
VGRVHGTKQLADRALAPTKRPIGVAMRRIFEVAAADVTGASSRRSCLVLAPHPDDETLGCGATMMCRLAAGSEVRLAVVTDGAAWPPDRDADTNRRVRAAELDAACELLGLPPGAVARWAFPDSSLADAGDDLVDAIAEAVREAAPAEVLATSAHDPHGDHAALGRAAGRALAGMGVRLLAYPIWQWDRPGAWMRTVRASRRPEYVSTRGVVDRKRQAIAAYASQLAAAGATGPDAGLGPAFIEQFLGAREIFFPVAGYS